MNKLPKGYYAITSDIDSSDNIFVFKGVEYEVEKGVNLLGTLSQFFALPSAETPDTAIEGLPADKFNCPVVLLSTGEHKIGKTRETRVNVTRSVAIFGQKAGISPNLPSGNRIDPPVLNPARADMSDESILRGSYYFGAVTITAPDVDYFGVDGVTCSVDYRFADYREKTLATDVKLEFKNIIHKTPTGKNLYIFSDIGADLPYTREVLIQNVRLDKDFFDLGYGGFCFNCSNPKTTFDNLCVDGTVQVFGLTNIPKTSPTGSPSKERSEITMTDCYLARLRGENGLSTSVKKCALDLTVENSTFVDASREYESPLQINLPDDRSTLTVRNCLILDTRNNKGPAIEISGEGNSITLENNEVKGFAEEISRAEPIPTVAPEYIENHSSAWKTDTEDSHTVVGTDDADFSEMDAYYDGCKAYYGDQHVHSNCGGTSDGKTPLGQWVSDMDKHGLDFAIIVDHRQMRGYFLPEWNEERMVMGTEPGTSLLDPVGKQCIRPEFHYNMVFPEKYSLAKVLKAFPEFEFQGDELTGSFTYPNFKKARLYELCAYLRSIGGMLVHAHPRVLMGSDDPMDYFLGENSYIEVIVGNYMSHASFKSYDTFCDILALGHHIYASGGSDTHGAVTHSCPSTFYTKRRFHTDFVERMYAGDYSVGGVGVKMFIDGHPMGSTVKYREGMKLTLRVGDFFKHTFEENTAYEIQVITDKGIAYKSRFNGKKPQALSLEVKDRRFYRMTVTDLTHGYRVCVSNPIWIETSDVK